MSIKTIEDKRNRKKSNRTSEITKKHLYDSINLWSDWKLESLCLEPSDTVFIKNITNDNKSAKKKL